MPVSGTGVAARARGCAAAGIAAKAIAQATRTMARLLRIVSSCKRTGCEIPSPYWGASGTASAIRRNQQMAVLLLCGRRGRRFRRFLVIHREPLAAALVVDRR